MLRKHEVHYKERKTVYLLRWEKDTMNRSMDMTKRNPARLILGLAIPLILANLGQQLYGIADAIIVGQGVGVDAFAALGACDWLNWMVLWFVQGLAQGFSALAAQKFGAGDRKQVRIVSEMCAKLCLVIGTLLTVVFALLAGPLLRLLRTPDRVLPDATTYLTMIYCGTLIILGYNMAAALLRSVGDGRTPLIAMCIAGSSNILLDLLFVMKFRWGIRGAAAATLLAQLTAFGYCLATIARSPVFRDDRSQISGAEQQPPAGSRWERLFWWDNRIAKELCHLGFPMGSSSLLVVIGGILAQSVINTYGYVFVAGCTAANKLHGLLDCSAVALGFASSSFIAQNYGAGSMDRVRLGIKKATVIAVLLGMAIMLAMFITGRQVVSLFLSADAENAAEALQVAYEYVIVMSTMLPGAYLMNLYRYSIQGLGNSLVPLLSGFFELGARVFVAFVFPLFLGQRGLFFMDGAAWWAAGIFQIICFYRYLHKIQKAE